MDDPNLQEIHDFLIDLARQAGQMIASANPSTVDTKKNCRLRPKLPLLEKGSARELIDCS